MDKSVDAVRMQRLLDFQDIFPDEERKSPIIYLSGCDKETLIFLCTHLMILRNSGRDYDLGKGSITDLLSEANDVTYLSAVSTLKKNPGTRIVNDFTTLRLLEYIIYELKYDTITQTSGELELNFFKSYLSVNTEINHRQRLAVESTQRFADEGRHTEHAIWLLLCSQFPSAGIENYRLDELIATQIMKARLLLDHLKSGVTENILLQHFLDHFGSKTSEEYLARTFNITNNIIKVRLDSYSGFTVARDKDELPTMMLLDALCIDPNLSVEQDYKLIRAAPFYKMKENAYRILSVSFFVESIYKGMYFKLKTFNDALHKGDKILNFKSYYGDIFAEQRLLYGALDGIYAQKKVTVYTGEQILKEHNQVGMTDYYLRAGKNIMLFESKDFLIEASKKASYEQKIYEVELKKSFYQDEKENGKVKAKACVQLCNTIEKVMDGTFKADVQSNYKNLNIYPVIVTHHRDYDCLALNHVVNMWFQEEVNKLKQKGIFTYNIRPVTIVNIDTLLYYKPLFQKYPLHEVLDKYWDTIRVNRHNDYKSNVFIDLNKHMMSFAVFMSKFEKEYDVDLYQHFIETLK